VSEDFLRYRRLKKAEFSVRLVIPKSVDFFASGESIARHAEFIPFPFHFSSQLFAQATPKKRANRSVAGRKRSFGG
jgi:hypothetical protein